MFINDSSEKKSDKTRKQYSAQVDSNTRPKGCDFFVREKIMVEQNVPLVLVLVE